MTTVERITQAHQAEQAVAQQRRTMDFAYIEALERVAALKAEAFRRGVEWPGID